MRVGERYTGVTSVLSKVRKGGRATYVATVLNSHWECVARVGRDGYDDPFDLARNITHARTELGVAGPMSAGATIASAEALGL